MCTCCRAVYVHRKRNIEQPSVCDSSVGEVALFPGYPPRPAFITPLHKQQVMVWWWLGGGGSGLKIRQGEYLLICRESNTGFCFEHKTEGRYKLTVSCPLCGQHTLNKTHQTGWNCYLEERCSFCQNIGYCWIVVPTMWNQKYSQHKYCRHVEHWLETHAFHSGFYLSTLEKHRNRKSGFEGSRVLHMSTKLTSVLCDLPTPARGQSSGHTALQGWGRSPFVHSRGGWVCLSAGLSWWHHELPRRQRGREEIRKVWGSRPPQVHLTDLF